jgi:hypothetical protein
MFARYKRSSLFDPFKRKAEKEFYNVDTRVATGRRTDSGESVEES